MIRYSVAASASALSLLALGGATIAAGDPQHPLGFDLDGNTALWTEHSDAAAYRVFGTVRWFPEPSCGPDRLAAGSESVDFDEQLPEGTTSFELPRSSSELRTWRKDLQVTVEALDADGAVLARDGIAYQADKFCTPEEIAAAGTGLQQNDSNRPQPVIAALLAFGVVLLFGGLITLRKRA